MKELRNSFDSEIRFDDLEKAKNYYIPKSETPCEENEYLGDDFGEYCKQFDEYKSDIANADSLEKLADVLNRYRDIFDNGSEYKVVEF